MNPWLKKGIINYAHQGGAKEAPSSTLFAMKKAIENGANALELDVHVTSDGHLVVCHDETVDATTQFSGRISDMTLSELKKLDNAYWFVPGVGQDKNGEHPLRGEYIKNPDLSIATVEEVLGQFDSVILNLDIKEDTGYENELNTLLNRYNRNFENTIVASFHHSCLMRFREISGTIATSASPNEVADFVASFKEGKTIEANYVALQIPLKIGETYLVTKDLVELAHQLEIAVHVWTVDQETDMRYLIDLAVDGIITDRPSLLAKVLQNSM